MSSGPGRSPGPNCRCKPVGGGPAPIHKSASPKGPTASPVRLDAGNRGTCRTGTETKSSESESCGLLSDEVALAGVVSVVAVDAGARAAGCGGAGAAEHATKHSITPSVAVQLRTQRLLEAARIGGRPRVVRFPGVSVGLSIPRRPLEAELIMRALTKAVVDAVWAAVEPLLDRPPDGHPLGCHRPRVCDRLCLQGIIWRLVTGCSSSPPSPDSQPSPSSSSRTSPPTPPNNSAAPARAKQQPTSPPTPAHPQQANPKPSADATADQSLGALAGIRTPNLLIRSQMLCPIELQALVAA